MKKETIEEVAENFCRNDETMSDYVQGAYITDFIQGAKWMQEQDRENLQVTNQHIYITNDEEIKEGDYCISHLNIIDEGKIHNSQTIFNPKTKEHLILLQSCKKIILTTDQDLIKDNVQAIGEKIAVELYIKTFKKQNKMILSPKEEAEIIANKFIDAIPSNIEVDINEFMRIDGLAGIECALIAVDMILDIKSVYKDEKLYNYWYEIQQELEKLKNETK
jgi:hypothetical protein